MDRRQPRGRRRHRQQRRHRADAAIPGCRCGYDGGHHEHQRGRAGRRHQEGHQQHAEARHQGRPRHQYRQHCGALRGRLPAAPGHVPHVHVRRLQARRHRLQPRAARRAAEPGRQRQSDGSVPRHGADPVRAATGAGGAGVPHGAAPRPVPGREVHPVQPTRRGDCASHTSANR